MISEHSYKPDLKTMDRFFSIQSWVSLNRQNDLYKNLPSSFLVISHRFPFI